ncbi:phospholipase A2 [Nonomuraea sp. NPDC050536]|uniref:phospholipase A2 n=1 Tax=Nonomuraea sp. NPDC050536 TaxID=3364366 RepID=UPI0037C58ABB
MGIVTRLMATVLLMAGLLITPAAASAQQAAPATAADVTAMWANYGDNGSGHWTGGDASVSVPLPDGRIAWLYADTFLGTVNDDYSRSPDTPFINNSLVVQDGTTLGPTLHGGTAANPTALVTPSSAGDFYWVADGTVEDNKLKVLYGKYTTTGQGPPLGFALAGTALATFSLPDLKLTSVRDLPTSGKIGWGSALMEDGAQTYIYGSEYADGVKFVHVARAAQGALDGPWEYWTGSDWSSQESASKPLMSGGGEAMSVGKVGNQYVAVTQENNEVFSSWIVAYVAASPTGPFTGPIYLHEAIEPELSGWKQFVYAARVHPELSAPGKLLLSYDVNVWDKNDDFQDARVYRPRFVEVAWPPPAPDPAKVPAAPSGLRAVAASDGSAGLTWTAPPGANLNYWVYRKDITAGQTHFARTLNPATEPRYTDVMLKAGHTYAYRVTAIAVGGQESAFTPAVTIEGRLSVPPAPTGLKAVPGTVGDVALTWTASEPGVSHHVYRRDITAGETLFVQDTSIDDPYAAAGTVKGLQSAHEYEFKVTAVNQEGESEPSNLVKATARFAPPAAPTNLTATALPDGSVRLAWAAPAGGAPTYWVHRRDVTAGETAFSRLDLPVSQTSTTVPLLTSGSTYEFKVTAENNGGVGPPSNLATATARLTPPAAPTGLSATPQADGSVKLNWTAPARARAFWVYRRDVTFGQQAFSRVPRPTEDTSMVIDDLVNGNLYEFKVAAVGDGGEGTASTVVTATAKTTSVAPLKKLTTGAAAKLSSDAPVPPQNLWVSRNGDGYVELTWDAGQNGDVFYWVQFRSAGQETWYQMTYPTTRTTARVEGFLWNGFTYEFRVVAENTAGTSGPSNTVSVTVGPQRPQQPKNVKALAGDHEVVLYWDEDTSSDVYYWVEFRSAGASAWLRFAWPVTRNEARVSYPLWAGYYYDFRVVAVNPAGESPPSAPVTAAPGFGTPQSPQIVDAVSSIGEIQVSWTPTSPYDYYWVYYRPANIGLWTKVRYPVARTELNLTYLPVGEYKIRITSVNPAGESKPSEVKAANVLPTKRVALDMLTTSNQDSQDEWMRGHNQKDHGIWAYYDFNWDTDYCTRPGVDQPIFPIFPPPLYEQVDWRPACGRHDFGYRNYQKNDWFDYATKHRVDLTFLRDMKHACDKDVTILSRSNCYALAAVYLFAVRVAHPPL